MVHITLLNFNVRFDNMTHDFIIKNIFDINLACRLCIDINHQINNYVNNILIYFFLK